VGQQAVLLKKKFTPPPRRFTGKSRDEYIYIMNNLNLPDPKMMNIAIPANLL
jgi:hypothetical protein